MGFWKWLFGSGSGSSAPPEYRDSGREMNMNMSPISPVSSGELLSDLSRPTERNPVTGQETQRFVQEKGGTMKIAFYRHDGTPVYGQMPRVITVFDLNDYGERRIKWPE